MSSEHDPGQKVWPTDPRSDFDVPPSHSRNVAWNVLRLRRVAAALLVLLVCMPVCCISVLGLIGFAIYQSGIFAPEEGGGHIRSHYDNQLVERPQPDQLYNQFGVEHSAKGTGPFGADRIEIDGPVSDTEFVSQKLYALGLGNACGRVIVQSRAPDAGEGDCFVIVETPNQMWTILVYRPGNPTTTIAGWKYYSDQNISMFNATHLMDSGQTPEEPADRDPFGPDEPEEPARSD